MKLLSLIVLSGFLTVACSHHKACCKKDSCDKTQKQSCCKEKKADCKDGKCEKKTEKTEAKK